MCAFSALIRPLQVRRALFQRTRISPGWVKLPNRGPAGFERRRACFDAMIEGGIAQDGFLRVDGYVDARRGAGFEDHDRS